MIVIILIYEGRVSEEASSLRFFARILSKILAFWEDPRLLEKSDEVERMRILSPPSFHEDCH